MMAFLQRSGSRSTKRVAGLMVTAGLAMLFSATAAACTVQGNSGSPLHLVIDAWDDAEEGKMIARWTQAGNAMFLGGCSGDVPFDITPALNGLEFVRTVNIDGEQYRAYGLAGYPRSPLLVFRHVVWAASGSIPDVYTPLDIHRLTQVSSGPMPTATRGSIIHIGAVSRGGIMERVPATLLGPISRVSPLFPQWVKTDTFTVTANLKVPTCQLSDTPVALVDVGVADLPASGRVAGERTFDVAMECNGAFPVEMVLTDANLPGNTGSR
ncbi:TPA: hypothetical protein ACKQCJ_003909, partial [Stenotrophomonas maltophilia]